MPASVSYFETLMLDFDEGGHWVAFAQCHSDKFCNTKELIEGCSIVASTRRWLAWLEREEAFLQREDVATCHCLFQYWKHRMDLVILKQVHLIDLTWLQMCELVKGIESGAQMKREEREKSRLCFLWQS